MRERRRGKGASLGKEAVLADSGRAGDIVARVARVGRETFSAACTEVSLPLTLEFPYCYGEAMALPNWKIGRALGIPIHLHASWFAVFFFVTWSLATGYLPDTLPGLSAPRYWGMGGIAALLLFLSVLLHELGHSYVALRYQIPIRQITLFIFGGMAHMGKEPPSPRAEFLIAMAGPLVSLILGAVCLGGAMAMESIFSQPGMKGLIVLGGLLGMVNMQLGLFNLIPGFPLDGGRVLRAGLWARNKDFHRATSQAAFAGIGFGVALGLIGVVLIGAAWSGASESVHHDERGLAHVYRRIPLCRSLDTQAADSPADVVDVGGRPSSHGPAPRDLAAGYECAGRGRSVLCRAGIWRIPCVRREADSGGGHSARRTGASYGPLVMAPRARDDAPDVTDALHPSGLVRHAGDGPHGPSWL